MKVIFCDLLRNKRYEYQTIAKELTIEGITRVLVVSTNLVPNSAKVTAEKGRWVDNTCWMSAGDQFRIDLVKE